jgi:hypothetical protein
MTAWIWCLRRMTGLGALCARLGVVLAGLLLLSCGRSSTNSDGEAFVHLTTPHARGLAENPKRLLLGMRAVGEKWICFRSTTTGGDEWIIDRAKDKVAVKRVRHDEAGKPTTETDVYLSGRRYVDAEGNEGAEELRVGCDWSTGVLDIVYLGDDRALKKSLEKLPPFDAQHRLAYVGRVEEIVKKWGLARP